jgi:hypothetical protein
MQEPPWPLDGAGLPAAGGGGGRAAVSAPLVALAGSIAATAGYLAGWLPFGPVLLCVGWATFEVARWRPVRLSAPADAAAVTLVTAERPRRRSAPQLDHLRLDRCRRAGRTVVRTAGPVVHTGRSVQPAPLGPPPGHGVADLEPFCGPARRPAVLDTQGARCSRPAGVKGALA